MNVHLVLLYTSLLTLTLSCSSGGGDSSANPWENSKETGDQAQEDSSKKSPAPKSVFSPNCEDREDFRLISGSKKCEFYKAPKPLSDKPEKDAKLDTTNALKHSAWARHLKRTFKVDVSRCSACGSDMKIMAIIHNKAEIARYLDHVKDYQRGPPPEVGDDVSIKVEAISELMTAD